MSLVVHAVDSQGRIVNEVINLPLSWSSARQVMTRAGIDWEQTTSLGGTKLRECIDRTRTLSAGAPATDCDEGSSAWATFRLLDLMECAQSSGGCLEWD